MVLLAEALWGMALTLSPDDLLEVFDAGNLALLCCRVVGISRTYSTVQEGCCTSERPLGWLPAAVALLPPGLQVPCCLEGQHRLSACGSFLVSDCMYG